MPLYRIRQWDDGAGGLLAGVYAITDPATMQAYGSVLTPYVSTTRPLQDVLGQDSLTDPKVTTLLHFPDFTTAQNVEAQVNLQEHAVQDPAALPDEIRLDRVKIAMALTASTHGGTLKDRVPLFIATLSPQQQIVASEEWDSAPNLVLSSAFAQGFKAWEGLSDAAWGQILTTALHMAL